MSVYAAWFIDWSFVSSSSCEATAIIVLIILSLYRGSAVRNKISKYCFGLLQSGGPWHKCVDGLGLSDFLGQVIPVSDGSWQEWVLLVLGSAVLLRELLVVSLSLMWVGWGGGGCSLFLIPSVAMMLLWILYRIANWAVFLQTWREVHFRSSIIAEALDVLLYRYMTKHLLDAGWPQCGRYVAGCMGPRQYTHTQELAEHMTCKPSP